MATRHTCVVGTIFFIPMRGASFLLFLLALLITPAHPIALRRPRATRSSGTTASQGDDESPTWQEATDPVTGRKYYWNTGSRETTWVRPAEMDAPVAAPPAPPPSAPVEPVIVESKAPRLTWNGPSSNLASRLATQARERLASGRETIDGWRAHVGAGMANANPPEREGKTLTKGLYLGGALAFGAAVL